MKFIKFYDFKNNCTFIVPDFVKNIFEANKFYIRTNNKLKKKIIIFFLHNSLLRKFKLLINILLNSKIIFEEPKKKKIIIFDKYSELVIKKIIKPRSFFTLVTRPNHFRNIYISKKIIFYLIVNFFKQSIKVNYLTILIKILDPKIIVTLIDQSLDFYIIAKIFKNNNISFIAIQNAFRDQFYLKDLFIHNDYSQKYYSFGEHEIKNIKRYSKVNPTLKSIGSARAAVANEYLKNKNFNFNPKIDICLVSELSFERDKVTEKELKSHLIRILKLANYCKKFSIKNNKKIVILGRYSEPLDGHTKESIFLKKIEEIFYKPFLKAEHLYLKFPNKSKFENFNIIKNSNLILGTSSTMLLESFAFKKKFLICEWGNIKQSKIKVEGICKLKLEDYSHFESRILNLLKINYTDFKSKNKKMSLIHNTNIDTLKFLRKEFSNK